MATKKKKNKTQKEQNPKTNKKNKTKRLNPSNPCISSRAQVYIHSEKAFPPTGLHIDTQRSTYLKNSKGVYVVAERITKVVLLVVVVTDAGPEGLDISQLPSAYTTAYNEQLEYPGELKVFIEVNCKELVHGGGTGGQAKYVAQCHMLKRTSDLTYIMNMPSLSQAETLQHPCRVEQMPKNHIFFNKEPEFDIPITNTDDGIDDLYFLNACKEKQDSLSKSKAEKFRKSYVKDKMNADGGVVMTAHARQRMRERHITEEDIVMKNVTVIYAQSKGPKIIVQTVYRKDKEDWKRDLIKKDRIKVERC